MLTIHTGNKNLCGPPLESCSISPAPPPATNIVFPNTDYWKKSQLLKIILMILIVVLIVAVLLSAFIIAYSNRRSGLQLDRTTMMNIDHYHQHNSVPTRHVINQPLDHTKLAAEANSNQEKRPATAEGKLTFLRDDRERFDLHDLLKASAEILGSGTFGASYKATIQCDSMVVKRYKQMNSLAREEFHEHMRRLGGLVHPNLLPLVAYYYRKEEKLLVYDFVENGSLAYHLHGKLIITLTIPFFWQTD